MHLFDFLHTAQLEEHLPLFYVAADEQQRWMRQFNDEIFTRRSQVRTPPQIPAPRRADFDSCMRWSNLLTCDPYTTRHPYRNYMFDTLEDINGLFMDGRDFKCLWSPRQRTRHSWFMRPDYIVYKGWFNE